MSRTKWWGWEYLNGERYLESLSNQDLLERFHDIAGNFFLNSEGKIGLRAEETPLWGRLMQHVFTEVHMRGQSLETFFSPSRYVISDSSIGEFTSGLKKEGKLLQFNYSGRVSAVKYGEAKYMRFFYETGEMLLSSPPNLNDDLPRSLREKSNEDCLLYCMSEVLDATLANHFGYDACVVIKDMDAFMRRVLSNSEPLVYFGQTLYLDPLFIDYSGPMYRVKHFRDEYQREIRFVWKSDGVKQKKITVGSIRDIAELVIGR